MVTILRTGLHLDLPNALVEDSPEQGGKCLIQPALASPRDWCHLEEDSSWREECTWNLESWYRWKRRGAGLSQLLFWNMR